MQVCGFVDGFVGGRIYLPLPSLPPFVFCFWIQTTRHWGHQRSGGKMAANVEMCRWSFCAENVRESGRLSEREIRFIILYRS